MDNDDVAPKLNIGATVAAEPVGGLATAAARFPPKMNGLSLLLSTAVLSAPNLNGAGFCGTIGITVDEPLDTELDRISASTGPVGKGGEIDGTGAGASGLVDEPIVNIGALEER